MELPIEIILPVLLILLIAQGIGLLAGYWLRIHRVLAALISGSIIALLFGILAYSLFDLTDTLMANQNGELIAVGLLSLLVGAPELPSIWAIAWLGGMISAFLAIFGFIINFLTTLVIMFLAPPGKGRAKSPAMPPLGI